MTILAVVQAVATALTLVLVVVTIRVVDMLDAVPETADAEAVS